MMKTGCTGTERPKNGTGGLRRVVLALAVLLLTCVLMAGAVSATDEWHEVTTFGELKSNLEDGNWTKLGTDITDPSGQIILTDVDDARFDLNGYNLTMDVDRSAIVIGGKSVSDRANLTVLNSKVGGKVNATNNYLFFVCNESTLTLESGRFEANYSAIAGNANGEYSNPTFTVKKGVELVSHGDVAVFLPAKGTTARITGATITGKLGGVSIAAGDITIQDTEISVVGSGTSLDDWTQGPNSDGSAIAIHKLGDGYKGDLTLRLLGTTSLSSVNGVVFHNYISDDQSFLGKTVVTIADTVDLNGGKITSATYGENCKGDGGVFKDTNGNILLYPSLNQTGVTWTGDDDSGYTLTIDEAGSYKLMDAFTTTGSGIQITAGGVTLDGNGKTITVGKMTNSAAALTVTETAAGTTLKNLNMMALSDSETGATMQGMVNLLAQTTILGGTLDMSGMSLPVDGTYGSNPTVVCIAGENNDGTTISGVTMSAPERSSSEDSSGGVNSNTFCVFINPAKNVKLDGNTFNLGGTAKRSVGVEVRGGSTGTVINGNTINAPENVEYVRAVQIFTNGNADESLTITNNELTGSYKAAVNAVLTSDENKRAENPTLPVTIEGNTIPNAEAGITISGTSETVTLKVTGTVEAADFSGLSQDQIISGTGVDVTDVDFNPQPQPTPVPPSYSPGSGNMDNAYRVLFNDGATTLSVVTDLSSGDKLTKPETPVKDGYTFAGWYKDSACTQAWDFETGISGDMTLYAKWTAAGSSGETEATTAPTATSTAVTTPQPTKTQSTTATTSAPEATTAAGVSPTLTQAPAPVAGALFGLLAAGVLLRRRFQ